MPSPFKRLNFRHLTIVIVYALSAWFPSAQAAWPSEQPIKLIVPFALGSITDIMARIVAPELSQQIGQTIVVENMPGESGHVGTAYAIDQKGDGYSLLYTSNGPLVIEPNLYKGHKRNFPWRDLSPVSLIAYTPQVLFVNRDWGVNSLSSLVKKLQDNPGKFNIGSDGLGSKSAVAASLFMRATQTDLMQVPYTSTQQIVAALRENEIQVALLEPGVVNISQEQKKLVPLAATSTIKPSPYAPDSTDAIPTFATLGYDSLDTEVWHAVLTPAGTPTRIVNQINKAIQVVLAEPRIQQKFQLLYFTPKGSSPYILSNRIELETVHWRVKLKGLQK
jgi:tripartite-type tricarboxylate transporter receptor subunit TctC